MKIGKYIIPVHKFNTVIVGTGAAGYNAADRLHSYGQTDIAIVTEGVNRGTSRNTGSDKQTYYKLTLSGGEPDSVREMAQTLFEGGCMDGDHALCEAAHSAGSFMRLVELGVPFPRGRFGEYVGYKTDHDPRQRATSVGPYTSKKMTETLQHSVESRGIPTFDGYQVIQYIVQEGKIVGLLCLVLDKQGTEEQFAIFACRNVIASTGAPAGMYRDSVFPLGHYGSSGIVFEAGATGKNLTEWQFGLSSVAPRWNVSGTYMQVLPKFISTDKDGGDVREITLDLGHVFLKGYQWPFDAKRAESGSSTVDIIVHREICAGRRVFLDFRSNPADKDVDFAALPTEAREYLEKGGACFGTPYQRLAHMNQPAIDFYRDFNVDLETQPLEIALCAQHNNGGIDVDAWWQTSIGGLFAVGEAAATHGVYRPGGSALNSGQVGSTRAAMYVGTKGHGEVAEFSPATIADIEKITAIAACVGEKGNVDALWEAAATTMTQCAGAIRDNVGIAAALQVAKKQLSTFAEVKIADSSQLWKVYQYRDVLLSQVMYLGAMLDYAAQGGGNRGSAIYVGGSISTLPTDKVQTVKYTSDGGKYSWRQVRPIPQDDEFFENVWREFRESGNIG
ncbi:MAG: FAD-binding protein [Oscillospiraceae bacterium]|nr:FAD-binding protein [Oscillospiraceae bacterium]